MYIWVRAYLCTWVCVCVYVCMCVCQMQRRESIQQGVLRALSPLSSSFSSRCLCYRSHLTYMGLFRRSCFPFTVLFSSVLVYLFLLLSQVSFHRSLLTYTGLFWRSHLQLYCRVLSPISSSYSCKCLFYRSLWPHMGLFWRSHFIFTLVLSSALAHLSILLLQVSLL